MSLKGISSHHSNQVTNGFFSHWRTGQITIRSIDRSSDMALTVELPQQSQLSEKPKPRIGCPNLRRIFSMHLSTSELKDPKNTLEMVMTWSDAKLLSFLQRVEKTVKETDSHEKIHYLGQFIFYLQKMRKIEHKDSHTRDALRIKRCINVILRKYQRLLQKEYFDLNDKKGSLNNALNQPLGQPASLFLANFGSAENDLLTDADYFNEANFYCQDYVLQRGWFKQNQLTIKSVDGEKDLCIDVMEPDADRLALHRYPEIENITLRDWLGLNLSSYELKMPNNDFTHVMRWSDEKAARFFARAEKTQRSTKSCQKSAYLGRCAFFYLENKREHLASSNSIEAEKLLICLKKMVERFKQDALNRHIKQEANRAKDQATLPSYDDCFAQEQQNSEGDANAENLEELPPDYDIIVQGPQTTRAKIAINFAAQKAKLETDLPCYDDL